MSARPPHHHHPDIEDVSREFVHTAITLALTLGRMAEKSYTVYGDRAHGDPLAAKVRKAATEIAHYVFLMESRAWEVTDLWQRYRALQGVIAGLHPPV